MTINLSINAEKEKEDCGFFALEIARQFLEKGVDKGKTTVLIRFFRRVEVLRLC
jgi:hypothetical protein